MRKGRIANTTQYKNLKCTMLFYIRTDTLIIMEDNRIEERWQIINRTRELTDTHVTIDREDYREAGDHSE